MKILARGDGEPPYPPVVAVLDLSRFCRLTRLRPDAIIGSPDDPQGPQEVVVDIEPITSPRAVDLVRRYPDMLSIHNGESLNDEERFVQIRRHVILDLTAAARLDVIDSTAAITAAIAEQA